MLHELLMLEIERKWSFSIKKPHIFFNWIHLEKNHIFDFSMHFNVEMMGGWKKNVKMQIRFITKEWKKVGLFCNATSFKFIVEESKNTYTQKDLHI